MLIHTLIGAGGLHLRDIERKTNCELYVDSEHGSVSIFARSEENMKKAKLGVNSLAGDVFPGHLYPVKLTKITDMGIYVQFEEHPGREGFIHVTEIFDEPRYQKIEDVYRLNDLLDARVIGYDSHGKLLMSLRDQSHPNPFLFTYISSSDSNQSNMIKNPPRTNELQLLETFWIIPEKSEFGNLGFFP